MKAFITGATGFLGINLVKQLRKDHWDVIVFHLPGEDLRTLSPLEVQFRQGNILDRESLMQFMPSGKDVIVFHLAGDTSMWFRNNKRQWQLNVEGTRNVCSVALDKNIGRMIHTSSVSAFGSHRHIINEHTESNALRCRMNYNRTKYLAEQEVRSAIGKGLDAVILNPCNIIGPYDRKGWSTLIRSSLNNNRVFTGGGSGTFAHVEHIAAAHIKAAEKGRLGQNYLLGGRVCSFRDMMIEIRKMVGRKPDVKVLPKTVLFAASLLDSMVSFLSGKEPLLSYPRYRRIVGNLRCDDSKAREELDFRTSPVPEMLKDCYDWMQKDSLLEPAQ